MVKVWLYAYAPGVTSSRRLEQRVREDHVIVEQPVTQEATDNASLLPLVEAVERHGRETPQ